MVPSLSAHFGGHLKKTSKIGPPSNSGPWPQFFGWGYPGLGRRSGGSGQRGLVPSLLPPQGPSPSLGGAPWFWLQIRRFWPVEASYFPSFSGLSDAGCPHPFSSTRWEWISSGRMGFCVVKQWFEIKTKKPTFVEGSIVWLENGLLGIGEVKAFIWELGIYPKIGLSNYFQSFVYTHLQALIYKSDKLYLQGQLIQ